MSKITLENLDEMQAKTSLRLDGISNSIDKLAEIMLKSFETISSEMNNRFSRVEIDMHDIKFRLDNTAPKFEIKDLDKRVTKLESKTNTN